MNEYQKALYIYSHLESEATVGEYTPLEYDKARKKLEELVEKTKPIKPYYKYAIDDTYYFVQNVSTSLLRNVLWIVNMVKGLGKMKCIVHICKL